MVLGAQRAHIHSHAHFLLTSDTPPPAPEWPWLPPRCPLSRLSCLPSWPPHHSHCTGPQPCLALRPPAGVA